MYFSKYRGCSKKKVHWAKYHNSHSSKSIKVTKLSFCQNDPPWVVNHFVKRTDWSLTYFLIHAYLNIFAQSQNLGNSLYLIKVDIFYLIKVDKKSIFLDYLPPSSCKRSLWTTPYKPRLIWERRVVLLQIFDIM